MLQAPCELPRVLLADDHAILRDGLRGVLKDAGFEVVGEASDGREAIKLTQELQPEIAILDIAMPVLNGIDASREILKTSPKTKISFSPCTPRTATCSQLCVRALRDTC